MDDYLEWLVSGLIFLWILGAYDASAAPVDPGGVRCELASQSASLRAGQAYSSKGGDQAANSFAHRSNHHAVLSYAGNRSRH